MVSILIKNMEEYALQNNIPIMQKEGIEFLISYIKENNIKNILEIGSAIGYSAIRMCLISEDIKVTTIERDKIRYDMAVTNIEKSSLKNRINIINDDAFNIDLSDQFDLIFIDAAKSQYIKFFEKFKNNLKNNGIIISDNLNFHGLTHSNEIIKSRNVRGIVRKLNNYIDFLKNNEEFKTKFIEIGDGIAISTKLDKII
ncbi:MAG: O-methyltransferase [Bacilli bacterium]|nr:O-methyltransferase [Bacilli bacterium]